MDASCTPWTRSTLPQCLKGRRIIMIGDSTMRQMFQSLACLLGDQIGDGFLKVRSSMHSFLFSFLLIRSHGH